MQQLTTLFVVADGPDRKTPYEDTLRAVNEEYKKGKFNRFGVSVSHSAPTYKLYSQRAKYEL